MNEIARAVALLRAGELVGIPTETVYGLGADASNPLAVSKIFAVKGRPADHPLIVHIPDQSQLSVWARDIPETAHTLARACWPGPLTLILKRQPTVLDVVTGGQETVGLRVPNHPLTLELLHAFGGGIAAPSANRFGCISPTTAAHVREELGDRVPLVLDGGACEVGIESTIVDCSGPNLRILRPGNISLTAIRDLLGYAVEALLASDAECGEQASVPRVSGSLAAHYAPRTPMCLLEAGQIGATLRELAAAGPVAVLARCATKLDVSNVVWRQMPLDAAHYAHDLYAALRELDHLACHRILVEAPPTDSAWHAVNDRLARAVAGAGGS